MLLQNEVLRSQDARLFNESAAQAPVAAAVHQGSLVFTDFEAMMSAAATMEEGTLAYCALTQHLFLRVKDGIQKLELGRFIEIKSDTQSDSSPVCGPTRVHLNQRVLLPDGSTLRDYSRMPAKEMWLPGNMGV